MSSYYDGAVNAIDSVKKGLRVFVPGLGMFEGGVQAVTTGDPRGAAEFFVPGIGIVEGAAEGSAAFIGLTGGAGGAVQNAGLSAGTLALLVGAALLVLFVVHQK